MLPFAVRCQLGNYSIPKPSLDNVVFVGVRLTDADVNIAPVSVDCEVAVTGSVVLCPVLDLNALNRKYVTFLGTIGSCLGTKDVATRRRNRAITITAW